MASVEKTWFDNIYDIYINGLHQTKEILHDKSIPWRERELRCLEALKEIKKMMASCRPPEVDKVISDGIRTEGKDAVAEMGQGSGGQFSERGGCLAGRQFSS